MKNLFSRFVMNAAEKVLLFLCSIAVGNGRSYGHKPLADAIVLTTTLLRMLMICHVFLN